MTVEELQKIMHQLQLDFDATPTLVYIFYQTDDGLINNLTLTVRRGHQRRKGPKPNELQSVMGKYPDAASAKLLAVEHLGNGLTRWLDMHDVTQLLHVSDRTIRRCVQLGLLHPSRLGRRLYYDADEVDRLLRSNAIQENGRLDLNI